MAAVQFLRQNPHFQFSQEFNNVFQAFFNNMHKLRVFIAFVQCLYFIIMIHCCLDSFQISQRAYQSFSFLKQLICSQNRQFIMNMPLQILQFPFMSCTWQQPSRIFAQNSE
ncbi:hypothetical protein FGO68_gene10351 [Halteria grandinella]|uniref:Transmembrane protein n=1 Tax=Halteria grandinella TaxID=5974 RepID=A0A8J8NXT8_HALGN|nr:hypothetical protein FGO68_gene10351 [Halteria grandinella]